MRPWTGPGALLLAALLSGCGVAKGVARAGDYRGDVLTPPWPAPDFTLTDTDGHGYRFREEASGFVTLLYFGYTNCPDVCPVHMAALSAALRQLPYDVSRRVKVVFVTVDPTRDTLPRLRQWLDYFDPDFIGLRGSLDTVNHIEQSLHLGTAAIAAQPDSSYTVSHSAAMLAVVGDSVRILYPFGTREKDWVYDLPKLVARIPQPPGGG